MVDRSPPQQVEGATGVNGVPLQRADHPREIEEVRITLRGRFVASKVPAVRLRGFSQRTLNQVYIQDSSQLVGGVPTWWSEDGLHFFYFDRDDRVWRANSLRLVGGAGIRAVAPQGRRAGDGIAHSGCVNEGDDPTAALANPSGWYEAGSANSWQPKTIDVVTDLSDSFEFHSSNIITEERHTRGADFANEEKHVAGPAEFRGWRHSAGVRLALPPLPDRIQATGADETQMEAIPARTKTRSGSNFLGDPDFLVLRSVVAAAKL